MKVVAQAGNCQLSIGQFPRFDFKFGTMRKPQDFIVNPWKVGDTEIILQSDKRIIRVNLETGSAVLSNGKGHPGFIALNKALGAKEVQVTEEQLTAIRTAVGYEESND